MPPAARTLKPRRTAVLLALGLACALLVPTATAAPAVTGPVRALAGPAATTAVPAALPTASKPARPTLKVVPGAARLTAEWTKIAGAKRYQVQVSTSKKFTKKTTRTFSSTSRLRVVTKLKKRTTYYVRVRAHKPKAGTWSKVVRTVQSTNAVGRLKATVKPGGQHKIRVSWPRLKQGTTITIVAAHSNETLPTPSKGWVVRNIPATRTSHVVTIPKSFRNKVGTGTGNPVYVRVLMNNGPKQSRSTIAWGWASPPAVKGNAADRITVASWNVGSVGATNSIAKRRWVDRRTAVANGIAYSRADVVGVQEATTAQVDKPRDRTEQYQDLAKRLASSGYALARKDVGTPRANEQIATHLYYRTDTVSVLRAGHARLKALAAEAQRDVPWTNPDGSALTDRNLAWALLKDKDSGREFLAASIHVQQGTHAVTQKVRNAAVDGASAFLDDLATRLGRPGVPVVLVGDLNSDIETYPNGPTARLVSKGYVHAASAKTVVGNRYASVNNAARSSGYPASPEVYHYVGTRIDHIFVKRGGGSVRYVNQVLLTNGRYDERYRGSDHNLQLATISLAQK